MKSTSGYFWGFKYHKITIFLDRLNKLLGDVVISQGGVVPFINPEVSYLIERTWPLVDGFLAAPAQQNAKRQEGESGGLDTLSLYHYCTTIRALLFYWSPLLLGLAVSGRQDENMNSFFPSSCGLLYLPYLLAHVSLAKLWEIVIPRVS